MFSIVKLSDYLTVADFWRLHVWPERALGSASVCGTVYIRWCQRYHLHIGATLHHGCAGWPLAGVVLPHPHTEEDSSSRIAVLCKWFNQPETSSSLSSKPRSTTVTVKKTQKTATILKRERNLKILTLMLLCL